jgi:small subunit ribosomal protein S20
MAHTKSTQKRIKQDRKKHLRNISIISGVRTELKKFAGTLEDGKKDAVKDALRGVYRVLDKAVTKGVLPKNTASRKKSRLALAAHAKLG